MKGFPPRLQILPKNPPPELVEVSLPGSKSYTNRALLLAALARGTSTLENALLSNDTEHMVECLNQLGVPTRVDVPARSIQVEGHGIPQQAPSGPLYCGNAGTAIRFLAPFCAFAPGPVVLTGNERMRQRPIADLMDGLRQLGGEVVDLDGTGCPPIRVNGGGLRGGVCRIQGTKSSQYFSALLLSAARMREGLILEVEGDLVSKPYIDMTLDILGRFGIQARNEHYQRLAVPQGQEPSALSYRVEGDASGASYFLAAAAVTRKTVRVGQFPVDSRQGDLGFAKVLETMGCRVRRLGECVEVSGGPLSGIEVDLNAMSDTAQTLAVVALFADGPTTICNIANARIKETDRITALCAELTRLGAEVEEFADGLTIHPASSYRPAEIETYDDHRMAMSFAVAALGIPGLILKNPACVTKTFPDFFELFAPWADVVSMG